MTKFIVYKQANARSNFHLSIVLLDREHADKMARYTDEQAHANGDTEQKSVVLEYASIYDAPDKITPKQMKALGG